MRMLAYRAPGDSKYEYLHMAKLTTMEAMYKSYRGNSGKVWAISFVRFQ
jgi:hypothetical protein